MERTGITMEISKKLFGKTKDGLDVHAFTLKNNQGSYITFLDYGATVRAIVIKDASGIDRDICLGYNTVSDYENNDGYLGACIGRVGNRIGKGQFTLNGVSYQLALNDGENHLHGGIKGFDKHLFDVETSENSITFSRVSPDGEENYPGNLKLSVTCTFNDDNQFILDYHAVSDQDTIINLTNHTYFNLSGENDGDITDHLLQLNAASFTANDNACLPTGEILPVSGSSFDFRSPKVIGKEINHNEQQLLRAGGYDHNFVLDGKGMRQIAIVSSPKTHLSLNVYTDKPGVQFYSGNFLTGQIGKSGSAYAKRSGFCLETQYFPNAMACRNFPSPVLRADEEYHFTTIYEFIN